VINGVLRRSRHWAKRRWQRRNLDQTRPTRAIFVLGHQRSGTSMIIDRLGQSPETIVYGEGKPPVFRGIRLADRATVQRTVRESPAYFLIAKPLCDSQWADQLLEEFADSRVLWLYRRFDDQINSALRLFSQQLIAYEIVINQVPNDWRTDRLSDEIKELYRRFHTPELTRENAAAVQWYARNTRFFEMELDRHPRARLVKYEDLVTDPPAQFAWIEGFVGVHLDPESLEKVHARSIGKNTPPQLHPELRAMCEQLYERLDTVYARARAAD
jgi:hypothetical protein